MSDDISPAGRRSAVGARKPFFPPQEVLPVFGAGCTGDRL